MKKSKEKNSKKNDIHYFISNENIDNFCKNCLSKNTLKAYKFDLYLFLAWINEHKFNVYSDNILSLYQKALYKQNLKTITIVGKQQL